jgi:hypothetical protein
LVALCSKELFYQLLLFDFGNFGALKLSEPPLLYELALLGLDQPNCGWKPEDGSKEEIAEHVSDLLYSKAEMLLDYFSLEISEDKRLVSLPWVLEKYIPDMDNLPNLVLGLSAEVIYIYSDVCTVCAFDPIQVVVLLAKQLKSINPLVYGGNFVHGTVPCGRSRIVLMH